MTFLIVVGAVVVLAIIGVVVAAAGSQAGDGRH